MLTRNEIHFLRDLRDQAARKKEQCFLVEGPKMISELLQSSFQIREIFGLPEWLETHQTRLKELNIPSRLVSPSELERFSAFTTPNQVVALVSFPPVAMNWKKITGGLTLVLDGIQDPGNLGTLLRIADWYGISQVICSTGSVDLYNPKTVQATMGSLFRVQVFYEDLVDFLRDLPSDLEVYGATLNGTDIRDQEIHDKAVLVIGSESHGISTEVETLLTHKVRIPSFSTPGEGQGPESLNAAVAAGILCHEFRMRAYTKGHHC